MQDNWIYNIAIEFLLCLVLTSWFTCKISQMARRNRLYDVPNGRSVHESPVPRLGGLTFFPVVAFTLALLYGVNLLYVGEHSALWTAFPVSHLLFVFCAFLLIYVMGTVDDLSGVRYRTKLGVEILVGVMLIFSGVYFTAFHGFCGLDVIDMWVQVPVTILLVVYIVNAMNMIDGIDGLASSLGIVSMLYYGSLFYAQGDYFNVLVAVGMTGCLAAFFMYNMFGSQEKHHKIFMGDTGSMTLGVVLSVMAMKLSASEVPHSLSNINPLILAYSPLIVPCFDLIRVFLYRVRHDRSPFKADKRHIHHKLMAVGLSQHCALLLLIVMMLLYMGLNLWLSPYMDITWLVALDALTFTAINLWLTRRMKKKGKNRLETEID